MTRLYIDLIVKRVIYVTHKFGDSFVTLLFVNIARVSFWCLALFISDSAYLTLKIKQKDFKCFPGKYHRDNTVLKIPNC